MSAGTLTIRPEGFQAFILHFRRSCTPPGDIGGVEDSGVLSNGPFELSRNRITLFDQFLDLPLRELGAGTVRGDDVGLASGRPAMTGAR